MKSMTGYGTTTGKVGRGRLYLELKSVNHRYCEVLVRIPPRMGSLEVRVREYLQKEIERGKADVFLKELEPVFGGAELEVDLHLAKQYQKALKRLKQSLKISKNSDFLSLVGMTPFVRTREKEGNYLSYWREIKKLLDGALVQVNRMRSREGAYLFRDQKKRLKSLKRFLLKIQDRSGKRGEERRLALLNQQGGLNAENNGLPADKMDITEELIRLSSHSEQYDRLLGASEPVGRKLDFLIQEMHREINTVGAKSANAEISGYVVDCKALLENLREQVQNII